MDTTSGASRAAAASAIKAAIIVPRSRAAAQPAAVKAEEDTSTHDNRIEPPQDDLSTSVQWIPIVVPLFGVLVACGAYLIGWAILTRIW